MGEPVQVLEQIPLRDQALPVQADDTTFGPSENRPRDLEGSARPGLTRNDELPGQLDRRLHVTERGVDPLDHRRRNPGLAITATIAGLGVRRELRSRDEQLALDTQDQPVEVAEGRIEDAELLAHAELGA